MKVVNERGYKASPCHRVIELKVRVMLDHVPGAWHEPIDIMNWIATHSYVQDVELVEPRQYEGTPLEFVYDSERATHTTQQDGPTMPSAEIPAGGLQTQHTPGPWSYDMNRHTHDYVIFREGAQHSDHVRKWGYIDDGGVVGSSEWIWIEEADARLIAAAPCLLEALQEAVAFHEDEDNESIARWRAAIARATGAA